MELGEFLGTDFNILQSADDKFIDITDNFADSDDKYIRHWCNIDDKKYYFKSLNDVYMLINELIGEELANYLNLPTVHYYLAKTDFRKMRLYGVISADFIEPDKAYLKDKDINMANIKKSNNYHSIMYELYKVLILDFYMSQIDRVPSNLVLVKNSKSLMLNDLFDYSASFNTLCSSHVYPYFRNASSYYNHFHIDNLITLDEQYICSNFLMKVVFPSTDLDKIIKNYPDLKRVIDKLYDYDLIKGINDIESKLGIKISEGLLRHYEIQEKSKQKIIERI